MATGTAKQMLKTEAQSSGLTWQQIQEITRHLVEQVRPLAQEPIDVELLNDLAHLMENVQTVEEEKWTQLKLKAFRHVSSPISAIVSRLAGAGRSPFVALSCLHYCIDDVARVLPQEHREGFLKGLEAKIQSSLG